jgi:hypothetical protein
MNNYPKHSPFKYIDEFNTSCASVNELKQAFSIYEGEVLKGNVDKELVQYLDKLFEGEPLIPIFSCSGHVKDNIGYILFRSFFTKDSTLDFFKPLLLEFAATPGVDLKIHYWNERSIGYCLDFRYQDLDDVLSYLIKLIC